MACHPICEAVGDVDPDNQCRVCLDTWSKPLMLQPCDHIFCFHCVRDVNKCPECRAEIKSFARPHRLLLKVSEAIQVACTDCGATMRRDESYSHVCVPKSVRTDAEVTMHAGAAPEPAAPQPAPAAAPPARDAPSVASMAVQTDPAADRPAGAVDLRTAEVQRLLPGTPSSALQCLVSAINSRRGTGSANALTMHHAFAPKKRATDGSRHDVELQASKAVEMVASFADGAASVVPTEPLLPETLSAGCTRCGNYIKATEARLRRVRADVPTTFSGDRRSPEAAPTPTQVWRMEATCAECAHVLALPLAAGRQIVAPRGHQELRCDCCVAKKKRFCSAAWIRFTGCTHTGCSECLSAYVSRRSTLSPYPPLESIFMLTSAMYAKAAASALDFDTDDTVVPSLRCPICVGMGVAVGESGRLDATRWLSLVPTIEAGRVVSMTRKAQESRAHLRLTCGTCSSAVGDEDFYCKNCEGTVCASCGLTPGSGCIHTREPTASDLALAVRAFVSLNAEPQCADCEQPLTSCAPDQLLSDRSSAMGLCGMCFSCGKTACMLCGATAPDGKAVPCAEAHLQLLRHLVGVFLALDASDKDILIASAVAAVRSFALGRGFVQKFFEARPDLASRFPVAALAKHGYPLLQPMLRSRQNTAQRRNEAIKSARRDPLVEWAREQDRDPAAMWRVVRLPEAERDQAEGGTRIVMVPGVLDVALLPVYQTPVQRALGRLLQSGRGGMGVADDDTPV